MIGCCCCWKSCGRRAVRIVESVGRCPEDSSLRRCKEKLHAVAFADPLIAARVYSQCISHKNSHGIGGYTTIVGDQCYKICSRFVGGRQRRSGFGLVEALVGLPVIPARIAGGPQARTAASAYRHIAARVDGGGRRDRNN